MSEEACPVPQCLLDCLELEGEIREMQERWKQFTGQYPTEIPVYDLLWKLHDRLTRMVSEAIGDPEHFVEWFIWENECGKRAMQCRPPAGEWRPITNVEELYAFIRETYGET